MLINNNIMEVHYITKSIYMAMFLSKWNYSNLPCHCNCNYERCSLWCRNNGKTFHAELLKNDPILNHIYHQMKYNQHVIKLILFTCLNRNAFATEDNYAVLILRVVHLSRCLKYCWCYLYDKKILSTTYWMLCLEYLVSQRSPKW